MTHDENLEIDPETFRVIEAISEILCIINESDSSMHALQILSAVTAFVLCNSLTSADEADSAYRMFVHVVGEAMERSEASGSAMWTRGTSH